MKVNTVTVSSGVLPVPSSLGLLENSKWTVLVLPPLARPPNTAFSLSTEVYSTVMTEPALTDSMSFRLSKMTSKVQPSLVDVSTL